MPLFRNQFIAQLGSILCVAVLTSCAMQSPKPQMDVPPINIAELDPFYLSFLKEQCRSSGLRDGSAESNACILKEANANRDMTMYKYSSQYHQRLAKAMTQVQNQSVASSHSDATGANNPSPDNHARPPIALVSTAALSQSVERCDQLQGAPELREQVIGKLLVANEHSDNKLDLLANHNKINADQKPLVKAFAQEHYACFQALEKGVKSVAEANAVGDYMNTTDEILAKLYSGDITVAQANSAFLKAKTFRDNALMRLSKQ